MKRFALEGGALGAEVERWGRGEEAKRSDDLSSQVFRFKV